jgi:2-oxoglutarate dehydrogenase E2 component (dihydrolipoamide succinyltransferase)
MAPVTGVLGEQLAAVGETVTVGAVIARIEEGAAPAAVPETAKAAIDTMKDKAADASSNDNVTLSPAVRRAVLEHGLDPSSIKGTGKDGRLTKDDVLAAAKAKESGEDAPSPAPSPSPTPSPALAAPSATGERREERVRMTRMRQTIARRLKEAQDNAAMLTTFNDCDMSAVIEAREKYKELFAKKHGIKLGFMSFFAKAACMALKDVPSVNAYIEGPEGSQEIVYHDYVDLSVAVSAPNGLVVPVVRDCDAKGFAEIELAIADLGARAREGTLTLDDMAGGTFTISNGGVFGSMLSTPIINPPQSAVLGLHRIEDRPVAVNGEVVIRPMMYLALSYDHRLIDGREAVTALKIIKEAIEDPTRVLIDL